jgi:hypothetical protein
MKQYKYGLAWLDRTNNTVSTYIKMPMDGTAEGEVLPVFLESAGKEGWLLCGMMDSFLSKGVRKMHPYPEQFAKAYGKRDREITDPKEVLELIFVKEV